MQKNTLNPPLNHWYPVAWGRYVSKKKPHKVVFFGENIVLFREDQGRISALPDRCPHRHAPLSEGKVVNGCIQCPYHGWQFSGEGTCVFVPGLNEEKQCRSGRNLKPFCVREQQGLVWIFYRNHEEAPLFDPPSLPFYEDSSYTSFCLETISFTQTMNAIENLLDATHTHFVHNHLIRSDRVPRKEIKAIVRPQWNSVEVEYLNEKRQSGLISRLFGQGKVVGYGRYTLPATAQLEYKNEEGTRLVLTAFFSPIDDSRVRAFIVVSQRQHRFIPNRILNWVVKSLFKMGMKQDREILELQSGNQTSVQNPSFVSTEVDLIYPSMYRIFKEAHEGTLDPSKKYPEKVVSIFL